MTYTTATLKQLINKLKDFCNEFNYTLEENGWHLMLMSNWLSSITHFIHIDLSNNAIMCFYVLENDTSGQRYPDYLTLAEMQELNNILLEV